MDGGVLSSGCKWSGMQDGNENEVLFESLNLE